MNNSMTTDLISLKLRTVWIIHYSFSLVYCWQRIKDKELERRKCLARDLSDLIVYAIAVPFEPEREFWICSNFSYRTFPKNVMLYVKVICFLVVGMVARILRETFQKSSPLFSSPEPKAQVSYCHSAPSVVRPSVVVCRPSVNFHIFIFFSRTAWWILMKLGRDEVLMVPYKCCCFSARSAQGRIQGGAKIGQRGSPSSRNFFFRPDGYSDKPNG